MLKRWHRQERAQGVVEFAILSTFLMLLFLGVVDFSRFLYYDAAVINAARVGAETASNHCATSGDCGFSNTAMANDYITQSVVCDASPKITLDDGVGSSSGQVSTCLPCLGTPSSCSSTPCNAACQADLCVKDICVDPLSGRTSSGVVRVTVGYSFQPFSALISPFLASTSCWNTGTYSDNVSTNKHTLCATSVGKVSR